MVLPISFVFLSFQWISFDFHYFSTIPGARGGGDTPNLAREPPSPGRGLGEPFASKETMRKQGPPKSQNLARWQPAGPDAIFIDYHGFPSKYAGQRPIFIDFHRFSSFFNPTRGPKTGPGAAKARKRPGRAIYK